MFASKNLMFGQQSGGYQISRSLRLRASASAYLNRTFGTPTNGKIWTFSTWFKLGNGQFGPGGNLLGTADNGGASGNYVQLGVNYSTGRMSIFDYSSGTAILVTSSNLIRDSSAWYHLMYVYDSTQATAANRIIYYINGVQVTSYSDTTYPSQNYNTYINNSGQPTYFGSNYSGGPYNLVGSYFADSYFVDGQALTPTSFGAFDAVTGVWNPKKYSGTYGTNGFYLNFKDPTSTTTIGYDYSGNSNNWTANNISVTAGTTYDSMVDVPIGYGSDTGVGGELRGNYAVVNPLSLASSTTLSEANLKGVSSTYNNLQSGTIAVSSGKWYWELTFGGSLGMVGIVPASAPPTTDLGYTATSYGYRSSNGSKYNNSSATSYGNTYTTNDVIGVALDLDNGKLFFSKNNTWQNSGDPAAGTNAAFTGLSGSFMPAAGTPDTTAATWYWNFGQRAFSYTAPSGFKALCTQNLPTATVSNGANYMAASLYTGTGASLTVSNAVNSISFQPDMVWVKSRSAATDHKLTDSVRGVTKALISDTTGVETTDTNGLTAFGTTGFTIGSDTTYNNSGATYIGWQWKGGGTAASNTNGSITSSVSANTTAGFSVVTYTGNGTVGATVGHGLGVTPGMVIVKSRSATSDWPVKILPYMAGGSRLELSTTNAITTEAAGPGSLWNATNPNSTVITLGNQAMTNTNSTTYAAYCFAPISGYSAFGSYTGNGSTDGPFVFTNMRPRWVMVKRTDAAGARWAMADTSRSPYNVGSQMLYADAANAEDTGSGATYDIVSNGFKIRAVDGNWNTSGGTYIYAAFAENPFTIARAR